MTWRQRFTPSMRQNAGSWPWCKMRGIALPRAVTGNRCTMKPRMGMTPWNGLPNCLVNGRVAMFGASLWWQCSEPSYGRPLAGEVVRLAVLARHFLRILGDSLSIPMVELADSVAIPILGFGTWQLEGADSYHLLRTAIDVGYRHLDTATSYANERQLGQALSDSGLDRSLFFVATKCPSAAWPDPLPTLIESLRYLDLVCVDLWLVHEPTDSPAANARMWEGFIRARERGLCRAIGVSNFSVQQIDEVVSATGVSPAVNQIEWNPYVWRQDVIEAHAARNIQLEGYSGLRRGALSDPNVTAIAAAKRKTAAQVLIRWQIQREVIAIPKSSHAERMISNLDVFNFVLTHDELERIDALAGRGLASDRGNA